MDIKLDKLLPVFILVRPQLIENVGAVARSMLNFGFSNLRIVNPREEFPNEKAVALASGAGRVLDQAQIFNSVVDACKDLNQVWATSARTRYKFNEVVSPETGAKIIFDACQKGQRIGILFGGERAGLSNEELFISKKIIKVGTNPEFSSLNLAQSVLLLAYQLSLSELKPTNFLSENKENKLNKANYDELSSFVSRIETELDNTGFFYPEGKKKRMKTRLRKLVYGLDFSKEDIKILHGVVKSLVKKDK